jgi:gluconokinase
MSPLMKLMWFSRHKPALAGRVRWWVGLKDYVLHYLTGELVTELSSTSATGLLSVHRRDWDADALELAQIGADQLPPILPTTAVLKLKQDVARNMGLPEGLPVAVGAADGPLGNLGTGAITTGVAGLSLGTSGAVRMAVPEPSFDTERRLFCYALTDDVWVIGGAVSNGGITLRWAGETFAPDLVAGGHADVDVLKLAAQAPVGSDGLVMLPYVLSERAPLWNADLSGAYLGIRRPSRQKSLCPRRDRGGLPPALDHCGCPRKRYSGAIHPSNRRPVSFRAVAPGHGGYARSPDVN